MMTEAGQYKAPTAANVLLDVPCPNLAGLAVIAQASGELTITRPSIDTDG
jgi:hypothetical protein